MERHKLNDRALDELGQVLRVGLLAAKELGPPHLLGKVLPALADDGNATTEGRRCFDGPKGVQTDIGLTAPTEMRRHTVPPAAASSRVAFGAVLNDVEIMTGGQRSDGRHVLVGSADQSKWMGDENGHRPR